jgi:hypothetical protein
MNNSISGKSLHALSPLCLRTDWFGSEREAKDARFALHMNKAKRGYD